jgi:TolB protein
LGECCELFVAELDGDRARQLTDELRYPGSQGAGHSAWSPDGRQIVVEYGGGRLWIFDVRTGELVQRLTDDASEPVWSPDGRLIAFQAGSPGPGGSALFTVRPDGTHLRQLTRPSAAQFDTEADWSPDGRWLLFRTNRWASPDTTT